MEEYQVTHLWNINWLAQVIDVLGIVWKFYTYKSGTVNDKARAVESYLW